MSESERETFVKDCFAYDNVLRKGGHFLRLEALQSARSAKPCATGTDLVSITDGPYAETKEQLGGILLLDADDLNHAAELMSKHPGIRVAAFEIARSTRKLQLVSTQPRICERQRVAAS